MKEKSNQEPSLEVTDSEVKELAEVSPEDAKKQKDYEERYNGFMKAFKKLEKKFNIKLLQVQARLIYTDTKEYEN